MTEVAKALLYRAGAPSEAWNEAAGRMASAEEAPEAHAQILDLPPEKGALIALARALLIPSAHCDLGPIIRRSGRDTKKMVGELISALGSDSLTREWIGRWSS